MVPDLRKEDRFSGGFAYEQWPGHNFYAGVPLRAKNGVNIGVYSVLDGPPRQGGLDKDAKGFLREMSRIVIHYLESRAAKDSIQRGERMIRGLGSFVEGKATLTSSTNAFEDVPGQQEGALNETQQGMVLPPLLFGSCAHLDTQCDRVQRPADLRISLRIYEYILTPERYTNPA